MNQAPKSCSRCFRQLNKDARWKLCDQCRHYCRIHAALRRERAINAGKCKQCSKPRQPEDAEMLLCTPCRKWQNAQIRKLRAERLEERLCQVCSAKMEPDIYVNCEKCREKIRGNYHRRKAEKKEREETGKPV